MASLQHNGLTKMCKIMGMTDGKQVYKCIKCGMEHHGDTGWLLEDGTVICKYTDRCSLRATRNKIEEQKVAGTYKPRWRKE